MLRDRALSVLVVDDSAFFVELLSEKMEEEYRVETETARNATQAVAMLGQESIDCIVSDYEMPETTGLELFELVKDDYDIPFILLTGQGDEEIASRALRKGVDDYLLKQAVQEEEPLDLLVNRIRNVVEQRQTQRKYEQLVTNSPDEIAQITAEGEILAANEAMATSLGVDQSELIGHQLSEFLPDDVAEGRLNECRRAITTGSAVTFQDSIGIRHFHNIAVPLSTAGQGESIQLVTREITLQKRNEQELKSKSEKLSLINRLVGHDINNDVQLLMGWAQRLENHVDDTGVELLERIDETSRHIAELTTIAKDFVDSLEGDTEIELEQVDLGSVLRTEVEKVRSTHDDTKIVVGDVPNVTVRANELLSSVFGNLLNNAIRHNDATEPEVHVEVEETEEHLLTRVADNGPGIPDDRKEEIFGRGDMGPESPGTGTGLYLVQTLVDQFGGTVWVKDSDLGGAAFVVELPNYADR